jgi:aminoglycoside 3-N-acetyltransferase
VTRSDLRDALARMGLSAGSIVLVHSSLSAVGWIVGGAVSVVDAFRDVLGPAGTIVVPAHTGQNRDPSRWRNPPVPPESWDRLRDAIPAYDPHRTPSYGVGSFAECVRTWPGARRSRHPQTSFAAIGPSARELLDGHDLASPLGELSPLRRLELAGAHTILIGVGYDRCTCFHLAEYRLPDPPMQENACAVDEGQGRRWVTYRTVALSDSDFAALGRAYEQDGGPVVTGLVGGAPARLLPVAEAVAFAHRWLHDHRVGAAPYRRHLIS